MKIWTPVVVVAMITLLAGCDSEPSQTDIEKAFQQEVDNTNNQVKAIYGNNISEGMLTKINSVKKISCEKTGGDGTYSCKVDADIKVPFVGQRKSVAEFKLIKSDSVWKIIQ